MVLLANMENHSKLPFLFPMFFPLNKFSLPSNTLLCSHCSRILSSFSQKLLNMTQTHLKRMQKRNAGRGVGGMEQHPLGTNTDNRTLLSTARQLEGACKRNHKSLWHRKKYIEVIKEPSFLSVFFFFFFWQEPGSSKQPHKAEKLWNVLPQDVVDMGL